MNTAAKKRILISPQQQETELGDFFRMLDFELCSDFNREHVGKYLFIVDDYLPDLNIFSRIQTKKTINPACQNEVRVFFNESFLKNELIYSMIKSYFSELRDFDLIDRFAKKNHNIYTLKIQDYLNIGYFTDTIVLDAYKNNYDFEKIREYLNFAIKYSYKIEELNNNHSIDVSYAFNNAGFAIQILMSAKKFNIEKEFNNKNDNFEIFSLGTNYFDVSYFRKREKVLLSSVWFKEKNLQSFNAYSFSEIDGQFNLKNKKANLISKIEELNGSITYENNNEPIEKNRKLHLARKFTEIIKLMRSKEDEPLELKTLKANDIDNYLAKYPRPEAISDLDTEIKLFIIKLLNDDKLTNNISEYITQTASSNLDPFINEIQQVIGLKTHDDLIEIVKLGESAKNNEYNFSMIEGWTEESNNQDWIKKKAHIVEQIENHANVIKESGRNIVEEDLFEIFSGQFNTNPEQDRVITKKIVEEAVSTSFFKTKKFDDVLAIKLLQQKSTDNVNVKKLKLQLDRIKNTMTTMKDEVARLRKKAEASRLEFYKNKMATLPTKELSILKRTVNNSLDLINENKRKEKKMKLEFERIIALKNQRNRALETQITKLKGNSLRENALAMANKLETYKDENQKLKIQIENVRMKLFQKNDDEKQNKSSVDKDLEIMKLKNELQLAQTKIDELKGPVTNSNADMVDNELLFMKFVAGSSEDEPVLKAKPVFNVEAKADDDFFKQKFQSYKIEMEEKFAAQTLELKRSENKLKLAVVQLEEAKHRLNFSESQSKPIGNNDILEKKKEILKLKQENSTLSIKCFDQEKKLANLMKKLSLLEKMAA